MRSQDREVITAPERWLDNHVPGRCRDIGQVTKWAAEYAVPSGYVVLRSQTSLPPSDPASAVLALPLPFVAVRSEDPLHVLTWLRLVRASTNEVDPHTFSSLVMSCFAG